MSRQLVLENNTADELYLRELQYAAAPGVYGHETRLKAFEVRHNFPAAIYRDHNRSSGRLSEIVIFAGGGEVVESLSPEIFLPFVKLIFELDRHENMVVYGIRPCWKDICRFSGCGFLGRDYTQRPMEQIFRSPIAKRTKYKG